MTNEAAPPPDHAQIITGAMGVEIAQRATYRMNVAQEIIIIPEDRVRLCLIRYREQLEARRGWIAPAGMLATIAATLVTTNFRDFYLKASTWEAFFALAGLGTALWLIKALFSAYRASGAEAIDRIVGEMKQAGASRQA